jgi:hypothetical protein
MRIRERLAGSGAILVMMLALASCGVSSANTPADDDETPVSTVTVPVGTPGKGATAVTNVTITIDRNSYAPGDEIHATATNSSGKTVYATDGKTNCSIFALEVKTGDGWQASPLAACADPSRDPVQLANSATHTATIKAQSGSTFQTGTYRLALSFSSFNVPPPVAAAPREGGQFTLGNTPFNFRRTAATPSPLTTVYSPAFEIR